MPLIELTRVEAALKKGPASEQGGEAA